MFLNFKPPRLNDYRSDSYGKVFPVLVPSLVFFSSGKRHKRCLGVPWAPKCVKEAEWKAIRFLRDDFKTQGETPTIRRVSTVGGIDTKQLFVLFPKKPAKKMAYIAGLPKPHGCV